MKKEIFVNCTFEEKRIALREDGLLVELFIDRPRSESAKFVGNIYKGRVENVLPGISSAFVNIGLERNAYIYITDILPRRRERQIENILKRKQEVLVQVTKEAIGNKGAKITMDISLPGRYLVLMPFEKHLGISNNISDRRERERLRKILDNVRGRGNFGLIVRTEAAGASAEELEREYDYLMRMWEGIHRRYSQSNGPTLLHREMGIVFQTARDYLSQEVEIFLLDSREEYEQLRDFIKVIAPELLPRIQLYSGKIPIFKAFNIEPEIQKIFQPRISLPSGGYIIIQEAESFCAIDVNTGSYVGQDSQEETVFKTNLEAATEVARQIRLRNVGGIIVVDFIDMKSHQNRRRVTELLERFTRLDKAQVEVFPVTRLGLVEMTRERKRESLASLLCENCPQCKGRGQVLSRESLLIKLKREIRELTRGRTTGQIKLVLHPEVANYFQNNRDLLEKDLNRRIHFHPDHRIDWEDYRLIWE